ncbi:MAG: glycerol-3-phosphate dehydrogenase/oxidase [Chloroflexi bacterium]|jgi:glycerol-3-phosphate dehydrogenase|nr:glycerol-3-phosphate dehydrogenase/oxidase [Chloroflexota bacterium]MBT4513460.1 glycerol-3-phosphate dehydrogenase/oxidase [Chloroflexota bacterium]MBT6680543.1 glycerol-3-phosphate dehydrogenase/oxidase [Chloroflexota bacterium]
MVDYLGSDGRSVDVLIIGGGATGLYTALESASRGYSTVLLERGDFASGTSSESTKLIHGGVRYLRQGRLGLVRESLRERKLLRQNAPHLVRPLPIAVPAYSRWQKLKNSIGIMGYSALSRGAGFQRARSLDQKSFINAIPGIEADALRGGIVFTDGQTDDARLALAIAKTAAAHGAAVLNHATVRVIRVHSGRVVGVEVQNNLDDSSLTINAKVTINATGVHTDSTIGLGSDPPSGLMRWSRGTHLVMPRTLLDGRHGLLVPETRDGRVVFALPWLNGTLVGTTDVDVASPDADRMAPEQDVEYLVGELKKYLPEAGKTKILSTFTGIRPLVSQSSVASTSKIARSHRIFVSDSGLVTVTGGKWTTARLMAEQTVSRAARVGGLTDLPSRSEDMRLVGAQDVLDAGLAEAKSIVEPDSLYGSELADLTELEGQNPELKEPWSDGLPYRLSHAVYAIQKEMAMTLEDVMARRTRAFFLNADAVTNSADKVADAISRYGNVDEGWTSRELARLPEIASRFRTIG